jgi:hypothetical protein
MVVYSICKWQSLFMQAMMCTSLYAKMEGSGHVVRNGGKKDKSAFGRC